MELFNSVRFGAANCKSVQWNDRHDPRCTSDEHWNVSSTDDRICVHVPDMVLYKSRAKLLTSDPMTFQHWVNPRPIVLRSEQTLIGGFCCKQRVRGTALYWKTGETIKIVQPIPRFQSWFIICQLVANQLAKFSCSACSRSITVASVAPI